MAMKGTFVPLSDAEISKFSRSPLFATFRVRSRTSKHPQAAYNIANRDTKTKK